MNALRWAWWWLTARHRLTLWDHGRLLPHGWRWRHEPLPPNKTVDG